MASNNKHQVTLYDTNLEDMQYLKKYYNLSDSQPWKSEVIRRAIAFSAKSARGAEALAAEE